MSESPKKSPNKVSSSSPIESSSPIKSPSSPTPASNKPLASPSKNTKSPLKDTMSSNNNIIRSSTRSRTRVKHYDPTGNIENNNENVLKYGKGNGIQLSDIDTVTNSLNKLPSDDDLIVFLHRLLYGTTGKSNARKKNIKQFQGYVYDTTLTRDKILNRLSDRKWTHSILKQLCDLLNIDKNGDKNDVIERIIKFLENPYDKNDGNKKNNNNTNNKRKTPKSSISNKSKKKQKNNNGSSTKKNIGGNNTNELKRPLTAFFIYSNETRQKVKDENPNLSITEVAKELGNQWRLLSPSKKKIYEDKSKKAKDEYNKAKTKLEKNTNTSTKINETEKNGSNINDTGDDNTMQDDDNHDDGETEDEKDQQHDDIQEQENDTEEQHNGSEHHDEQNETTNE